MSPEEKTDLRVKRGEQTRKSILAATMEILSTVGREGFSAQAIANKAGISKGSLFHHFKSLEEIPMAAINQWAHSMLDPILEMKFNSLEHFILEFGARGLDWRDNSRQMMKAYMFFIEKAYFDETYRKIFGGMLDSHLSMFHHMVRGLARPDLTPEEIEDLTLLITSALKGYGVYFPLLLDKPRFTKSIQMFAALIQREYGKVS